MLFLPSFQTVDYAAPTHQTVQARSTLPRTLIVQTAPGTHSVEAGVRRVLAEADPNLTVLRVLPMAGQVNGNFRIERLLARLITIYGALALAADRWRVVRTCVRGPLVQTSIGLAVGLVASAFIGQAISAQLYGVEGFDAGAFAVAMAALVSCAVVAALLPARHAASVNPSAVLRGE